MLFTGLCSPVCIRNEGADVCFSAWTSLLLRCSALRMDGSKSNRFFYKKRRPRCGVLRLDKVLVDGVLADAVQAQKEYLLRFKNKVQTPFF
jgi:hypothetical protein